MDQINSDIIQRRDFPRYATETPIPVSLTTTKNQQAKGETINISKQGLCVKLDISIPLLERVDLQISLHNSKNVLNKGRIIWSVPELSLYGVDMTEYKESIPAYWEGYLTGVSNGKIDRREKIKRRENHDINKDNAKRKIDDRRTDKPIFKKCGTNKIAFFLKNQGNWFREYSTIGIPHSIIDKTKHVISFSYCNYLGLNNDLRVKKIMIDSIKKDGTCIASSRLSCGTTNVHMRLEKKLADFIGGESCITYTLGYTANVGALSALSNKSDILLIDEKSHASLMDGCFLSESKMFTYRHNDMSDLKKKLNNLNGDKLIVTDGVFSMDGDLVKLDDVYDLAKKYNAGIYLDDAHGVGVLGKNGGGTPEHFGLKGKIDLVAGTLSKAISSQGGYVVGKKNIIDYLKHTSRSFIFNISLQHYFAEGALKAIDIIENEPDIRLKLWENVNFLKENLINLGFNLKESCTPIIPLIIGDDIKTSEISKILADNGIIVDAVFYPVVKRKESMVRIIVNKQHSQHDLIRIIDILEIVGKKFDLI